MAALEPFPGLPNLGFLPGNAGGARGHGLGDARPRVTRAAPATPSHLPAATLEVWSARIPGWHTWSAEGSAGPRGGGRNLELEFPGVCTSPARPYKKAAAAAALPLGRLIPGAALPKGPPP